jgi:hypothetical protein
MAGNQTSSGPVRYYSESETPVAVSNRTRTSRARATPELPAAAMVVKRTGDWFYVRGRGTLTSTTSCQSQRQEQEVRHATLALVGKFPSEIARTLTTCGGDGTSSRRRRLRLNSLVDDVELVDVGASPRRRSVDTGCVTYRLRSVHWRRFHAEPRPQGIQSRGRQTASTTLHGVDGQAN